MEAWTMSVGPTSHTLREYNHDEDNCEIPFQKTDTTPLGILRTFKSNYKDVRKPSKQKRRRKKFQLRTTKVFLATWQITETDLYGGHC